MKTQLSLVFIAVTALVACTPVSGTPTADPNATANVAIPPDACARIPQSATQPLGLDDDAPTANSVTGNYTANLCHLDGKGTAHFLIAVSDMPLDRWHENAKLGYQDTTINGHAAITYLDLRPGCHVVAATSYGSVVGVINEPWEPDCIALNRRYFDVLFPYLQ